MSFCGLRGNSWGNEAMADRALNGTDILSIPIKAAKLQVVLDWLVELFEPERRYPEAEVNAVINQVHEDHATLRRLLVDYRLMDRAGGVYWRLEK
jgi:hypothetical protein